MDNKVNAKTPSNTGKSIIKAFMDERIIYLKQDNTGRLITVRSFKLYKLIDPGKIGEELGGKLGFYTASLISNTDVNGVAEKLNFLTDFVPSTTIRKKQRKLIADEYAEIIEFSKRGETTKVKWRLFCLKIHWVRYLISYPASAITKLAKKII